MLIGYLLVSGCVDKVCYFGLSGVLKGWVVTVC